MPTWFRGGLMGRSNGKAAVRRYFDNDAAGYLDAYRPDRRGDVRSDLFHERREIVLEMMPPAARILDVGAGPGVFTRQLLDRGSACWVVDLSFEMIAAASREVGPGRGACFMVADLDRLPFKDRSVDAAICVGVLQYLPSLDHAFGELARVIAPGGSAVLTFPNARSPLNLLHRGAIVAARGLRRVTDYAGLAGAPDPSRLTYRPDIPNCWLSMSQIDRLARAAGFALDEVRYHALQFPFNIPGLGFAIRGWNRLVHGMLPTGWLAASGREGIVRLKRLS